MVNLTDLNGGKASRVEKIPLFRIILALSVVGLIFFSSTLAANININTSQPIEFGKGLSQIVTCQDKNVSVTLTPQSNFHNASQVDGGGSFIFSNVLISNISDACKGVSFKVIAYNANNQKIKFNSCASDGTSISAYFNGDSSQTNITDASSLDFGDGVASVSSYTNNSFDLNWNGDCNGSPESSSNIYRVFVQTFNGPVPSDGSTLGGFNFVDCASNTRAPCSLYGSALYAQRTNNGEDFTETFDAGENSGPLLRECPSGSAVIGLKYGENQYVGEVSPICSTFPSRSVEHQFTTWSLENPGYLVESASYINEQRCTNGKWIAGFGGRAGSINDALQILCRTINGNPGSARLGVLIGGMGGGPIDSRRCVQGEIVTGIWVWGLHNDFTGWNGAGGGEGLAFRCTRL